MYAKPMMLNEKLGEQLPLHFEESVQVTELYGIEVELEGKGGIANPTDKIMENWVKHNDGSLRKLNPGDEAVEYVSRIPQNKIKTTKPLMDLIEFLTRNCCGGDASRCAPAVKGSVTKARKASVKKEARL